jgi:hypothetical protein
MSDLPDSLHRYRRQLERAVTSDLTRRRRRTRTRLGAVAAIVAVIAVVVNVLPSGDGSEPRLPAVAPASAVERAVAALRPDDRTILHVHMLGRQFDDERPGVRWQNEFWIGPGGRRSLETSPDGRVVETEEAAHGVQRIWDGERVLEAGSPGPGSTPAPNEGFREEVLASLHKGARVVGRVRRDGREALKIAADAGDSHIYIVDARTYNPIEFRTRGTGGGTVLRFETYERLPVTADTRRLLSISAQHGDAPVVRDPAAYQDAVARLFPHG